MIAFKPVAKTPRVGVALILCQSRSLLVGRRRNAPEAGSWQLPGGWIRVGEDPQEAVRRQRELFVGIECGPAEFVTYSSNRFDDGTHSISLYFELRVFNAGSVDLGKNTDCSDWTWVSWQALPNPRFLPLRCLQESGYTPLHC